MANLTDVCGCNLETVAYSGHCLGEGLPSPVEPIGVGVVAILSNNAVCSPTVGANSTAIGTT